MVDYDFERKETFLQLRLDGYDVDGGELPDKHLWSFIEAANTAGGLHIEYNGAGNALPQIRVGLLPYKEDVEQYNILKEGYSLLERVITYAEDNNIYNDLIKEIRGFVPKVNKY